MNALSPEMHRQIEQKIAIGWSVDGIARELRVSAGSVRRVRRHLDSIRDVDLFDLFDHRASVVAARDLCGRGHKFTPENTYRKGNGRRECRKCKMDRQAARYRAAGLAA